MGIQQQQKKIQILALIWSLSLVYISMHQKSLTEDSQHAHTKVPPAITHIVHSINHTMPKKAFSFGHSRHTEIEPKKIKYLSEHPTASTAEKETF